MAVKKQIKFDKPVSLEFDRESGLKFGKQARENGQIKKSF